MRTYAIIFVMFLLLLPAIYSEDPMIGCAALYQPLSQGGNYSLHLKINDPDNLDDNGENECTISEGMGPTIDSKDAVKSECKFALTEDIDYYGTPLKIPLDCSLEGQYVVRFNISEVPVGAGTTRSCTEPLLKIHDSRTASTNIDWDTKKQDCVCYDKYRRTDPGMYTYGVSWLESGPQNNKCCGNDITDCGVLSGSAICSDFLEGVLTAPKMPDLGQPTTGNGGCGPEPDVRDFVAYAAYWAACRNQQSPAAGSPNTPKKPLQKWWWATKDGDVGANGFKIDEDFEILYLPCGGYEVMSKGGSWVACGGDSTFTGTKFSGLTIPNQDTRTKQGSEHSYLCVSNNSYGSIVECCSENNCFSGGGLLPYVDNAQNIISKYQGDVVFRGIKNQGFELGWADDNNGVPQYWKGWNLDTDFSFGYDERSYSGIQKYNLGKYKLMIDTAQASPGEFGLLSNMFKVDGTNNYINFNYYVQEANDASLKVEIWWYDTLNEDQNETTQKTTGIFSIDTASGNEWKRFFRLIPKHLSNDYARLYIGVVKSSDPQSKLVAYIDNLGYGEPNFCKVAETTQIAGAPPIYTTSWIDDLDEHEGACESMYQWTGSQCCGDDMAEYYNDDGYKGGCWDDVRILNGTIVHNQTGPGNIIQPRVINYDGSFYGCEYQGTETSTLTSVNNQLVTQKPYCTTFNNNNGGYFCSHNGTWTDEKVKLSSNVLIPAFNRTNISSVPETITISAPKPNGCCPQGFCWTGEKCIQPQNDKPNDGMLQGTRHRCIEHENGDVNWTIAIKKHAWDYDPRDPTLKIGYCVNQSKCLLKNQQGIRCVDSGNYTEDHYCENGTWSTRTKLVAQALLDFVADTSKGNSADNFTLFCDKYQNVLNDYEYKTKGNNKYIGSDSNSPPPYYMEKSNNVCILRYKDGIIYGASLNEPVDFQPGTTADPSILDSTKPPFLEAIDEDDKINSNIGVNCGTSISSPSTLGVCSGATYTERIWYHKGLMLVFYVRPSKTLGSIDVQTNFLTWLFNPIQKIIDLIVNAIKPKVNLKLETLGVSEDFNQLFINRLSNSAGTKKVVGVVEGYLLNRFMTLEFEGFTKDICKSILARKADNLECQAVVQNSQLSYKIIGKEDNDVWRLLTGALRLQEPETLSTTKPPAQILAPLQNKIISHDTLSTTKLIFTAQNDSEIVSYYWDANTERNVINGHVNGLYENYERVFFPNITRHASQIYGDTNKLSGPRNITLITIDSHGNFNTNSIIINFVSEMGCTHRLGDFTGDGIINLADSDNILVSISSLLVVGLDCTDYPNGVPTKAACSCADMDQDGNLDYALPVSVDEDEFIKACGKDCDKDEDTVLDSKDNCKNVYNPPTDCDNDQSTSDRQCDGDNDDIGDVCDPCNDADADGHCYPLDNRQGSDRKPIDNCPDNSNPVTDCDNDASTPAEQCDADNDGIGDACDT